MIQTKIHFKMILILALSLVIADSAQAVDLYSILEVHSSAEPAEIHSSWKRLMKLNHPDLHPAALRDAQLRIALQLNVAHDILAQPDLRYYYDLTSDFGRKHHQWSLLPRHDLDFLIRKFGHRQKTDLFAMSLRPWERKNAALQYLNERGIERDSSRQMAILGWLESGFEIEILSEVVARKFLIESKAVAERLLRLRDRPQGVAITQYAIEADRTHALFRITRTEAEAYLERKLQSQDPFVKERAGLALSRLKSLRPSAMKCSDVF